MKKIIQNILIPVFLFAGFGSNAQFDPDKMCRIDDGQLIFTINLNWSDKEKKQLSELFDSTVFW